jgi:perosamine synthetase
LLEIGKKHGLPIIEDAAEAIGSLSQGKRAGSMGRFGCFSFHGSKTLTTGEGGMFVTNDADLYETVLTLSNHGRARNQKKQFWPDLVGYKYKMSNIQAAIGCGQMKRIDDLTKRKREILAYYRDQLEPIPGVMINPEPAGTVNGAWMPTVVFDVEIGVTTEKIQHIFAENNIDARVFFHPLSGMPMFEEKPQNRLAYDIPKRAINLPSYHEISIDEQDRVISIVRDNCYA